jgi:hypothetical protein
VEITLTINNHEEPPMASAASRSEHRILTGMDYAAFKEEEQRIVDSVMAKAITEERLWIEVERLRSLVPAVEPAADRDRAERSLKSLERALNYEAPPMSDEMADAIRIQSQALLSNGTPAERLELLQAAIAEIVRISRTVTGVEGTRIRQLGESLAMDIEGIRFNNPDLRQTSGNAEQ